jgi:hypothetical protein
MVDMGHAMALPTIGVIYCRKRSGTVILKNSGSLQAELADLSKITGRENLRAQ